MLLGFSGRGDKDLAALERFDDVEPWESADDGRPARRLDSPCATGTNDTAGARRIAAAFARARAEGRAALIPYVVAGYPDAETSLAIAPGRRRRGRRPARGRAAVLGSARRRRDAPARLGRRFGPARRSSRSLRLSGGSPRRARACPLVAMGYANQLIGGGDGGTVRAALAKAGVAGSDRRRPHARRGRTVRGGRRRGGDRGRLPRGADDARRRVARPSRPAAAGSSTASRWSGSPAPATSLPPTVGRLVRDVHGRITGAGRGRLRRESPGPRARDRAGRRRRGHRGVGPRRRAGPEGRDIAPSSSLIGRLRAATRV